MGDLFSERERGKYVGIFAAAFAVSTVVGPVMGGGIVQHASWRIVFWINIPICVIAMAMIFFTLKLPKTQGTLREKIRRVDFIGCALFTIGMVPILLGLSWGGQQYEWTSAPVLACLIAGFVVILVFLFVEYRFAAEPIVPVRLFGNVNVLAALASAFTMGATMVGATLSIPIFNSILNSHIKTGVIKLASEFPEYAAAIVSTRDDQRNIYKDTTPSDIRTKIIKLWADSMHSAFFSLVVFGGVFLVCCFAIKHVELGKKRKKTIE
ncbi:hypothetical protein FBU59_000611 [Linderina macrospora]|uniref:Uncharacterized protein n=1 Tax=Linderina macrospora TaxID=4868 RepID=A0ACC1JGC6_9FUNG|nr:hypothetical protein FBU59_000611 [Linderina macrospora]